MPIAAIIQAILAGLAAAPKAVELANAAKAYFQAMFNAGLITKATQDACNARVDAEVALFATVPPSHWQVQPDPPAA